MRVRISADERYPDYFMTNQLYEAGDPVVEIHEADYFSFQAAANAYERWQRLLADPEWIAAHDPR